MRTLLPKARATRPTVDSRTSSAWFSSREMVDFLVFVMRASVSAFHPGAFVYLVYLVVALRKITRLRQEKTRVN